MTSGEAGPSPSALQRLSQQEFPHSPVLGGGRGRWRKMQVLPPRRQRPSGERGRQAREETSCHWSGHIRGRPSGDTWAWSLDGEEAFCTRGGLPGGAVAGAKALRLEEPSSRGGRRGTEGPSRGREANSGQATEDLAAVEGMWPFSWERRGDPEDDRTAAAFEETVEEEKVSVRQGLGQLSQESIKVTATFCPQEKAPLGTGCVCVRACVWVLQGNGQTDLKK